MESATPLFQPPPRPEFLLHRRPSVPIHRRPVLPKPVVAEPRAQEPVVLPAVGLESRGVSTQFGFASGVANAVPTSWDTFRSPSRSASWPPS